jgi:hypothetical protein
MTLKEKELISTEMKELEVLMSAAFNFEVHLFSASFDTGEKYQCRPADLCNAFGSWYCNHGFDTYRKTPRDACYYLVQKLRAFNRLNQTQRDAFRYRGNPTFPEPAEPLWTLN